MKSIHNCLFEGWFKQAYASPTVARLEGVSMALWITGYPMQRDKMSASTPPQLTMGYFQGCNQQENLLGAAHKWRHVILKIVWPPQGCIVSRKCQPPPPHSSFMNGPLLKFRFWYKKDLLFFQCNTRSLQRYNIVIQNKS